MSAIDFICCACHATAITCAACVAAQTSSTSPTVGRRLTDQPEPCEAAPTNIFHAVAATASTRRTRLFRDGVRATQDPVIEDKHAAALEKTISKASDVSNSGKDFSFGSDEVPPEVKDMSTGHAISA